MIKTYTLSMVLFIISSMLCANVSALSAENKSTQETHNTILILGDSLSAAYGIPIEQAWVALLEKTLEKQFSEKQTKYQVHNASISGETTDGGLRALPKLLEKYKPSIVIIELGANDGLRGFPLPIIEQNLSKLTQLSQQTSAKVLLTGIHIPPNYGQRYAHAFHQIYIKLSEQYQTALVPFLLEGIATKPELMQDDRLHPKVNAQEVIMKLVWEQLEPML